MFDLANDERCQEIVRRVFENGGVIGGVCHGPAGFVNVRLSNGNYLVSGRKVTGFSNDEEAEVKLTEVVPFLLEDKLKENGAIYTKAPVNWGEHICGQGTNLITGQNPNSASAVAEAMLASLNANLGARGIP
jgi:putative intracellular protease/amidase